MTLFNFLYIYAYSRELAIHTYYSYVLNNKSGIIITQKHTYTKRRRRKIREKSYCVRIWLKLGK